MTAGNLPHRHRGPVRGGCGQHLLADPPHEGGVLLKTHDGLGVVRRSWRGSPVSLRPVGWLGTPDGTDDSLARSYWILGIEYRKAQGPIIMTSRNMFAHKHLNLLLTAL